MGRAFKRELVLKYAFEDTSGDVALDPAQTTALFRIAQESLTNVARHAKASLVVVKIEIDAGRLHVSIADNGVGFESSGISGPTLGLLGMEERARLIGGRFKVRSAPGSGTTISVELPISLVSDSAPGSDQR